jgi:hypothetical protein
LIQRGDFSISTSCTESPMFASILAASVTQHPILERRAFDLNESYSTIQYNSNSFL